MAQGKGPSLLALEEYYSTESPLFLDRLRSVRDPQVLIAFLEMWKRDHRPWARQQILAYVDGPLNSPGHQSFIKRLFKHAESNRDHELMAAFMAAFDRLLRRKLKKRYEYDYTLRQSFQSDVLVTPANGNPALPRYVQKGRQWIKEGWNNDSPVLLHEGAPLFSNRTRGYLRRRAWRYFRRLGFQKTAEYPQAVARALRLYTDHDLKDGIAILDSWGLVHACFFGSPAIAFTHEHANLAPEHSLKELAAAPYFPQFWRESSATALLLDLVATAQSRVVRAWSMQLIRAHHRDRLTDIAPQALLSLLDHPDEEVQQFGADLLSTATGLERFPLATWLVMLKTRNLTALQLITDVMRRHVTAERFELPQLIELATSRPTPVARLGLEMLRQRRISTAQEREQLAFLAAARSPAIGGEITEYALSILAAPDAYATDPVARFFDSLLKETRNAAWRWLLAVDAAHPAYSDSTLYSRLLETPYDDVRHNLIHALERRSTFPGASPADLSIVWSSTLLNIHRGGRHKLKALRQISDAIAANPAASQPLIPVAALALRSVRAAESRAALAALVRALEQHPALAETVVHFIPELDLSPQGAC